MRRYRLLAALAGVLAVVVAAPFAARQVLDSSWGHRQVQLAVARALGRDLRIDGPLHLDWRPGPVLVTGPLALSDRDRRGQLASVSRLVIGIRTTALLTGHLEINRLEADHLDLHLSRDADGHTNIDDLLAPKKTGGRLRVRPRIIVLRDAQVSLTDARRHLQVQIGPVSLHVDNLRPGAFGHVVAATTFQVTGAQEGQGDLHLAATVVPSENADGARIDQSKLDVDWQGASRQRLQVHLVAIGSIGMTAGTLLLPGLSGQVTDAAGDALTRVTAHFDGGRWTQAGAQLGRVSVSVDRRTATGRQQLAFAEDADDEADGWDTPRPFSLDVTAAGLSQSLSGQWQLARRRQIILDDLQGKLLWRGQPLAWQGTAMLDPLARTATAQVGGTLGTAHFTGQLALASAPVKVRADLSFDRLDLDALTQPAAGHPATAGTAPPAACDVLGGRIQAAQLVWHGWTARQAVLDLKPAACGVRPVHG